MKPETETRIAQLMADVARLSHQVVDLQNERDQLERNIEQQNAEFLAQLKCLHRLHSDLTNADMVMDDGEHSGYLITNEQIDDMEHFLSEPLQCLRDIQAEAIEGALKNTHTHKMVVDHRLYHSQEALLRYAERVRRGEA